MAAPERRQGVAEETAQETHPLVEQAVALERRPHLIFGDREIVELVVLVATGVGGVLVGAGPRQSFE
jgi:hypothetical protein